MFFLRAFMFLLPMVGSLAYAQQQMPSDIDLKSAYCLTIIQERINLTQTLEEVIDPSIQAGSELSRNLKTSRDDVQRLRTYLLSKTQFLDVTALLGAKQRAEADVATSKNDSRACVVSCTGQNDPGTEVLTKKIVACVNSCAIAGAAGERMRSCMKVDWLPY